MIKNLLIIVLIVTISSCSIHDSSKISTKELVEVLDIKYWRLPGPTDTNNTLTIKVDTLNLSNFSKTMDESKYSKSKYYLITIQDIGSGLVKFHIKSESGISSGKINFNLPDNIKSENMFYDNLIERQVYYNTENYLFCGDKIIIGEVHYNSDVLPIRYIYVKNARSKI